MRELVLKMSVSLDGFVRGRNGEVDWIFRTGSDDAAEWVHETLASAGLHAMGGGTFREMSRFWPGSDLAFAAPMNDIPKVRFSRRKADGAGAGGEAKEHRGSWDDPFLAGGDLAEQVALLKAQSGKPILAHGGGSFARSLAAAGLVDEYRLMVHPVALGAGDALFGALAEPLDLSLVSATAFSGGAVALVYRRS